jgi:hypothetical protein
MILLYHIGLYWQYIAYIVSFCMVRTGNPYREALKNGQKYIAIYCDPHWF